MSKRQTKHPAPAAPLDSTLSAQLDGRPATILVVDDEPRNIEVVTHFLEADGFGVISAEDGEHALAVVAETQPDVILLDVMMPLLDGFEVCRRLKADPATVFIPVVILTGLKSTQDRITGAAAGADDFLTKPFDHVELVTRVKSLVRVKRLNDQMQNYNRELEIRVAERTAELQHALAQLQELDRLKSEFIANVSHELRTPLLHVKGYIGLIADGALGTLSADQKRGIDVAQDAANQLERTVQDIVDFREMDERRLNFERVSVAEVCGEAIQSVALLAAHREVTVTLHAAPDLPPVIADRVTLRRVLGHLLDNAIKFSPASGTVEVIAEKRPQAVRFAVRDYGEGIAPEKLEHIFDMFYQGDGSTTRRAGGMGLGLALVKVLLEAHWSEVRVQSETGRGSTFYFDLQLTE
jgi:signal transduction histidine kinase